jgi:TFIIF-interacting CTD phosphatase-like protein
MLIDNSPMSILFQQENSILIKSWFDDPIDRELYKMIPMFTWLATLDDPVASLSEAKLRFLEGDIVRNGLGS